MNNLSNKNKNNNKKGKNILAFFAFPKVAFVISVGLLILALSIAYPLYMDGKAIQKNTEQLLERFENIVVIKETSEPQNIEEISKIESTKQTAKFQNIEETFKVQSTKETAEIKKLEETLESENAKETSKIQSIEEIFEKEELYTDEISQHESKPIEEFEVEHTPIAKLYIEKIGLEIVVLSEWSYELLEISVNKFRGPEPNETGNFIVIGHNYSNGEHFGNIDLIEIDDFLDLTDLSGRKITYKVYEILIIEPDEVEKLITNEPRTLTLVTCDTNSNLRLVIKSKDNNE